MRSLANQTVAELGGGRGILYRQKQDHVRLDKLWTGCLPPPVRTGNRICPLVFTHAFAEEAVPWPAQRRSLADGDDLSARVECGQREITELVAALDRSSSGDPRRQELIDCMVGMLRQDVREEEDVLLPRLQQAVGVRRCADWPRPGRSCAGPLRHAPIRSSPDVPRDRPCPRCR